MRPFLATYLVFFICAGQVSQAATIPLRSFSIDTGTVGCDGKDHYINIADYPIGAGKFPEKTSILRGFQIWANFRDKSSYVTIGKTAPYGDAISAFIHGSSASPVTFYPAGSGFPFDPTKSTEQLHIHYMCSPSDETASFGLTIFYSQDSDKIAG
jgi:hypothetical protein